MGFPCHLSPVTYHFGIDLKDEGLRIGNWEFNIQNSKFQIQDCEIRGL
jgi:hypothetical protein